MDKLSQTINYFHKALKTSNMVKDYLKSRGVSKESIIKYKLGYAPAHPAMCNRFHDRLIFPIHFPFGKLAGWTARTLINSPAKYINVKESAEFQKGRLLYLYHYAKKSIIKTRTAILVEGQMDALILHQFGLPNTVAASGVAFKSAAARILSRYAQKIYIVFDADDAGRKAQIRTQKYLEEIYPEELKMQIIVVNLPENEDPASFVLKHGKNAFISVLRSSKSA